jgi:hypothetical protein
MDSKGYLISLLQNGKQVQQPDPGKPPAKGL